MKYSEKLQLMLNKVPIEEIKALEEQEVKEAAEAAAASAAKEEEEAAKSATALEAAQEMIKDLESKLTAKEDELTMLNKQFADLNNKQTVKEQPTHKDTAVDVMKQLFTSKKEE